MPTSKKGSEHTQHFFSHFPPSLNSRQLSLPFFIQKQMLLSMPCATSISLVLSCRFFTLSFCSLVVLPPSHMSQVKQSQYRTACSCYACAQPLDFPYVYQRCQHIICSACSFGRRDQLQCPRCVTTQRPMDANNSFVQLDIQINHSMQVSQLIGAVAGQAWVEKQRGILSLNNTNAFIESTNVVPRARFNFGGDAASSGGASFSSAPSNGNVDNETVALLKQVIAEKKKNGSADDDDVSCARCVCRNTLCCIPRCFCPREEEQLYKKSKGCFIKIGKIVAVIVLIIWCVQGFNWYFTGSDNLNNVVNGARGFVGYTPIDFNATQFAAPGSDQKLASTPPPPPPPASTQTEQKPLKREL